MAHDNQIPDGDFQELEALAEALAPDSHVEGVVGVVAIRAVIANPVVIENQDALDRAWEKTRPTQLIKPKKQSARWATYAGIAAALVVAVTYVWNNVLITPESIMQEYSTRVGQRLSVTLADGSNVILAPATTLHIAGRYVKLSGEAVFTVEQRSNNPFTVRSGSTVTRVLGTTFGIRAYDDNIRVAVQDGKVSVNNNVLSSGDVADVINDVTNVHNNSDVASILAWTTGHLVLDNIPLRDAIPELERWYGITVTVRDQKLLQQSVITTLGTQSPREAITTLAIALGAQATFYGNRAVLTAR